MSCDIDFDDLRYQVADSIATITIDRPGRLNALRPHSLTEMARALQMASADSEVGVVVITGAGDRAFCAGGDLDVTASEETPDGGRSSMGSTEIVEWVSAFRNCTKPIIAKVRGHCLGLGNELNMLCDLTVAGDGARFGQAGPKVGSVPLVGGTQLLPLVCGFKRAKEILFLCRTYSGRGAVEMGLANVVVPDAELDDEVSRWAAELLEKSPQSLRVGKTALSYLFDIQWPALQHGLELTGWLVASPEMQEGARAFVEKRRPRFRRTRDERFVDDHLTALLANDFDTVVANYAPDAVLREHSGELRGRAAIRAHLEKVSAGSSADDVFDWTSSTSDGWVHARWRLTSPGGALKVSGVERFLVREGRIAEQEVEFDPPARPSS